MPPAVARSFEVVCSVTAAAELREADCQDIIRNAILMAQERDRGVHEGMAFRFEMHGKEWEIVVDLVQGWVKIFGKDEFDRGMKEGVQRN